MEHDDAFWRFVDIPNLERRLAEAQDAVGRTDQKIELMESHLADARAAREQADEDVEALETAHARAAEVPDELAVTVKADVAQRNRVRTAVVKAMAETAEATAEANGAS